MKAIVKVNEEGLALLKAASMVIEIIWTDGEGPKKVIQGVRRKEKRLKYGRNPFLQVGKVPAPGNHRSGAIIARIVGKHLAESGLKMISRTDVTTVLVGQGMSSAAVGRGVKMALDKGWLEAVE